MTDGITRIKSDIEYILDIFRPVLDKLQGNNEGPIYLSSFTDFINFKDSGNWVISLLKANLISEKAMHMVTYNEKHDILHFYIILDELIYKNSKEIKKIVIVHEFIHFLSVFFACIDAKDKNSRRKLFERLSKSLSDGTKNEKIFELNKILNSSKLVNDFYNYEQVNDNHFRIGIENIPLDYSELFKNFLFSRKMLDQYFNSEKRKIFFNLLKKSRNDKANKLLNNIMDKIVKNEFLPKEFVFKQVSDIIMEFYANEYINISNK